MDETKLEPHVKYVGSEFRAGVKWRVGSESGRVVAAIRTYHVPCFDFDHRDFLVIL